MTFVDIKEAEEVSHLTEGKKNDKCRMKGQDSLDLFPFFPMLVNTNCCNRPPDFNGLMWYRCFLSVGESGSGWWRLWLQHELWCLMSPQFCLTASGDYIPTHQYLELLPEGGLYFLLPWKSDFIMWLTLANKMWAEMITATSKCWLLCFAASSFFLSLWTAMTR